MDVQIKAIREICKKYPKKIFILSEMRHNDIEEPLFEVAAGGIRATNEQTFLNGAINQR